MQIIGCVALLVGFVLLILRSVVAPRAADRSQICELIIVQAHCSTRRTLRDRFSRWITPSYIRYVVGRGAAFVIVGAPGTGKTSLVKSAKLRIFDVGSTRRPAAGALTLQATKPPQAVDEPTRIEELEAVRDLAGQVGRGFVVVVQRIGDLDGMEIIAGLKRRSRVEFAYLDVGDGRDIPEVSRWIQRHWPQAALVALEA